MLTTPKPSLCVNSLLDCRVSPWFALIRCIVYVVCALYCTCIHVPETKYVHVYEYLTQLSLSSPSPRLQFHMSLLRALHPLLLHSHTHQHFLVSCVLCTHHLDWECTCTLLLLVLLCVLSVYPSLSPSPPPLTRQLSLHPLHHFHVPVVQSLLSLSLLLQLVSCVCVSVCVCVCVCAHVMCVCVCMYVSMCANVCVCACVCGMCVRMFLYMCVFFYEFTYLLISFPSL